MNKSGTMSVPRAGRAPGEPALRRHGPDDRAWHSAWRFDLTFDLVFDMATVAFLAALAAIIAYAVRDAGG
jgi:hypothetical protein